MKKWIALLMALAMVFGLAACGNKTEEVPAASSVVEERNLRRLPNRNRNLSRSPNLSLRVPPTR